MTVLPMTFEAVYEDGIFRPVTPVPLAEHQRVQITVDVGRTQREWPADTDEIYRELAEDDRRIAMGMLEDIRTTWPKAEEK